MGGVCDTRNENTTNFATFSLIVFCFFAVCLHSSYLISHISHTIVVFLSLWIVPSENAQDSNE
jgi:hypothetical protein